MLSSKAESKLIANSGRTPPPLSPGSAVARILLPTATSGWVGEGVLPTAKIVPGSRKLFQGSAQRNLHSANVTSAQFLADSRSERIRP